MHIVVLHGPRDPKKAKPETILAKMPAAQFLIFSNADAQQTDFGGKELSRVDTLLNEENDELHIG
jgi:hypothetical protein